MIPKEEVAFNEWFIETNITSHLYDVPDKRVIQDLLKKAFISGYFKSLDDHTEGGLL